MTEIKYAHAREYTYGWDWTEFGDDNGEEIIVYDSKQEAQTALDDYISDINQAFEQDDMEEPYSDDCKVIEVVIEDGYASNPEIDEPAKVYQED